MAPWTALPARWYTHLNCRWKPPPLSVVPVTLAFITSFLVLIYVSLITTSDHQSISWFVRNRSPALSTQPFGSMPVGFQPERIMITRDGQPISAQNNDDDHDHDRRQHDVNNSSTDDITRPPPSPLGVGFSSGGDDEVFHDKEIFLQNYKEMKRSLKIYIYPHNWKHPFANALLPLDHQEPGGNYASEAYFKKVLFKSHLITNDSSKADLFFLPFSIARLRHDRRVGVGGLQDFIKDYMANIIQDYPYWNRTGGADHFYVACHSIGRMAMGKVEHVKANAIQVVCSSSYFLPNYFAHKDVCLPQIWPRHEEPPGLASTQRKKLAFFAGSVNSPVRKAVIKAWRNDSSIFAHSGRLKTPYSEQLLRSKYCLHVKGYEVNTARVGDSLYYGCVPVIIADYYDLPFMDILNWRTFSVVVTSSDIPNLKVILQNISPKEYSVLQANVMKVRKHFQWSMSSLDFDAFYMVMYELWLRRSSIRVFS